MDQDEALLSKIADGDESAMNRFYQKHANHVYQFAMKTLNHPVDASEVLNEVMMEVWRKADTFRQGSKVSTWLLSITHHKAVDAVRKNSRHNDKRVTTDDDKDLLDLQNDASCDVLQLNVDAENKQHVHYCLEQLSQGHRQVVYLTFFQGLSYTDIADTLDVPSGTVKTRMLHAKKLLSRCISQRIGNI